MKRTVRHYATPLAVAARGSVAEPDPCHNTQVDCERKPCARQQTETTVSKLSMLKAALTGAKFPKTAVSAWWKRPWSP